MPHCGRYHQQWRPIAVDFNRHPDRADCSATQSAARSYSTFHQADSSLDKVRRPILKKIDINSDTPVLAISISTARLDAKVKTDLSFQPDLRFTTENSINVLV